MLPPHGPSSHSSRSRVIVTATTPPSRAPSIWPHVAVVATTACPHCARAKRALRERDIAYEEIVVDDRARVRTVASDLSGMRTVPQVFVGGVIFGGADDTEEGLRSGTFVEALTRAREANARGAPMALVNALASDGDWKSLESDGGGEGEGEMTERASRASARGGGASAWYAPTGEANARARGKAMGDRSTGVTRTNVRRFNGFTDGVMRMITTHEDVFTARRAVDWLVANGEASNEDAAVALGAAMLENKIIVDVDATNPFVLGDKARGGNEALFRFQSDAAASGRAPLNMASVYRGEAREAKIVVEDVRRRILKLYDEFLSEDGRAVNYDGIRASEGFKEFVAASEELQRVNLNALSREERMAFFINVYNALVIHGTCAFGTPKNTLERLRFFSKTSYNIGGHAYTCDDIENGVLRGNRPGAASLGALLGKPSLSRGPFREGDPRRYNVILPMDPRIHFALVCGARSCPPIRVYTSEYIDRELEDAAFAFFESEIDVVIGANGAASSAAVSKIVGEWYKFDFGATSAERLRFASTFMKPGSSRDALTTALDRGDDVALTTRPYDWSLNDNERK